MSQTLKHLKVSTIADGPDPNQVNPSDWNAAHVFSGGALGGLLMRDTGDATYGASWLAGVAAGNVLISNGVAAAPSWSASPSLASLTLSGALTALTVTAGAWTKLALGVVRVSDGSGQGVIQAFDVAYRNLVLDGSVVQFYTSGVERIRITATGDLGVVTGAKLYFDGVAGTGSTYLTQGVANRLTVNVAAGNYHFDPAFFIPGVDGGPSLGVGSNRFSAVYAVNGTIQTSDRGAKVEIAPSALGLDFIRALRPSEFAYVETPTERRHGLIAQDVIKAAAGASLAGIVSGDEGSYGINYAGLVTPLVNATHELEARIAALEARA